MELRVLGLDAIDRVVVDDTEDFVVAAELILLTVDRVFNPTDLLLVLFNSARENFTSVPFMP